MLPKLCDYLSSEAAQLSIKHTCLQWKCLLGTNLIIYYHTLMSVMKKMFYKVGPWTQCSLDPMLSGLFDAQLVKAKVTLVDCQ